MVKESKQVEKMTVSEKPKQTEKKPIEVELNEFPIEQKDTY